MNIGINQSDLLQLDEADMHRVLEDIKAFGFQSVRFAVDWGYWSNFLGATNYTPARRVAQAFELHGLTPLPVLGCHYPFVRSATGFGNFTGKVVEIFGEIPYYEVWNEPNLIAFNIDGGVNGYMNYLRKASPRIRNAGSQVISAGLAAYPTFGPYNKSPWWWLTAMYDLGEKEENLYDVLGYHPYSIKDDAKATFVDPRENPFGISQLDELIAIKKDEKDDRPLAFTEVGFAVPPIDNYTAANWLGYQLNSVNMLSELTWVFCWRDTPGDGGKYGLVDSANLPKGEYYDFVKGLLQQ